MTIDEKGCSLPDADEHSRRDTHRRERLDVDLKEEGEEDSIPYIGCYTLNHLHNHHSDKVDRKNPRIHIPVDRNHRFRPHLLVVLENNERGHDDERKKKKTTKTTMMMMMMISMMKKQFSMKI